MQAIVRSPVDGIYGATDDYVHAMEVVEARRLLFISGTMGLDSSSIAGASLDEQLRLIWANLRRILGEAEMSTDNVVRVTTYLGDRSFAEANQKARIEALGRRRVPTTAIVVNLLDPWLVEIEVIAAA